MTANLSSSDVEACMTVVLPVCGGGTDVTVPLTGGSRPTTVDVLPRGGGNCSVLSSGGSLAARGGGGGGGGGGGARSPIRQLKRL